MSIEPRDTIADVLQDALDGYGDPEAWADRIVEAISNEECVRALIILARPKAVPDQYGDIHCLRLWPRAQCQYVQGHYGGCSGA